MCLQGETIDDVQLCTLLNDVNNDVLGLRFDKRGSQGSAPSLACAHSVDATQLGLSPSQEWRRSTQQVRAARAAFEAMGSIVAVGNSELDEGNTASVQEVWPLFAHKTVLFTNVVNSQRKC